MIGEEDKERVRQATDFQALVGETVELRRRGQDFWGCCPFHHEKSPSFHMNPATGLWNCFGCHKGGDVFDYVMEREHLEFPDAIRYLADRAGIELAEERNGPRGPKRNRLQQALAEAQSYYATMLMRGRGQGPQEARSYFAGRGFGSDVCRRWGLGFAPGRGQLVSTLRQKGFSNEEMLAADLAVDRSGRLQDRFYDRVMFPIHDEQGRSIGFGGRVLGDGKPKYLNTRETSVFRKHKHLFALDRAKEQITATGTVLVVEGYTDVISLHEHGFANAVAALGTALSLDHVKTLSRFNVKRIICMFDGDAAGQKAAELSVQYVDKTDAELMCVVLPDNQDPMEFLSSHPAWELQEILDHAAPLVEFVLRKKLAGFDLGVPGQRVSALGAAAEVLAPLVGSVSFDGYAINLAHQLDTDVEVTKNAIRDKARTMAARQAQEQRQEQARRGGSRGGGRYDGGYGSPAPSTAPAYVEPPYDDGGYVPRYDAPAPDAYDGPWSDPEPTNAYGDAPDAAAVLSLDAREQLSVERELLSLLANAPDAVKPYGERLGSVLWADSRHEAMAWAMLATPDGTQPAQMVAAATAVIPEAPRILAGGGLALAHDMDDARKAAFLADVLELYSTRREIKSIQARLHAREEQDTKELLSRALELRRRETELNRKIPTEV